MSMIGPEHLHLKKDFNVCNTLKNMIIDRKYLENYNSTRSMSHLEPIAMGHLATLICTLAQSGAYEWFFLSSYLLARL